MDAQFIGLREGNIHLHKTNGIKIAVPIPKMSVEDLEYVEKATGVSLDEDKPLSGVRRRSNSRTVADTKKASSAGASFQQSDYDWFDFFLKAGVGPHLCERYAQNFVRDSMDESVLPDITPENLRTLGLKEGDILRVMRYLDTTLGRTGSKSKARNVSFGGEEIIGNGEDGGPSGLFSGPGGVLHNNTRKSRPAPAVQTGDVVDPKVFEQKDASKPQEQPETPSTPAAPEKPVERGFEDDAWEVKHPKQPATSAPPASAAPAVAATAPAPAAAASPTTPATTSPPPGPTPQQLTGALADLSILHPPLQPQPSSAPQPQPAAPLVQAQPTGAQPSPVSPPQPQQTGASPGFFSQLAQQPTGLQQPPRQRPQPPQSMGQSSLLPPPPPRPLSAPQNFSQQPPSFGASPLQPQLTGIPQTGPQLAPPGQSLAELSQQRFQPSLQPQPTGFQPQSQFGIQQQQQLQAQQQGQFGFPGLAPQPTGFGGFQPPQQQPMATGINTVLPPALQPQPTGLQPQPTGMNGFGNVPFTTSPPPVPPIPQQPTAAPLQPQKTGPPPSVRFGVKPEAQKLAPQPTGLKANLAQATPTNPFGF